MSTVGYRIIEEIKRPSIDLIESFRNLQVANLDDCMQRNAAVHSSIKPINQAKILGPALTVKVAPGDNLMIYIAIDLAHEGDVLVIDGAGYTERALMGEIMIQYARNKKLGGIIIDGAIRDFDVISKMDFPVYAKAVSPNGPYKNGSGEINYPITIGSKVVHAGDIVVGDADGVVFIRPHDAPSILKKVQTVIDYEKKLLNQLAQGELLDITWAYKKLHESDCTITKEEKL